MNIKAKLKEEKEAKRATLDERHYYILQLVSDRIKIDITEAEDYILEGEEVILFPEKI